MIQIIRKFKTFSFSLEFYKHSCPTYEIFLIFILEDCMSLAEQCNIQCKEKILEFS